MMNLLKVHHTIYFITGMLSCLANDMNYLWHELSMKNFHFDLNRIRDEGDQRRINKNR